MPTNPFCWISGRPGAAPCRMVGPIVEEIARERTDIKVGKVNVDEQAELAGQFGVMSIPTLGRHQKRPDRQPVGGGKAKNAILAML